MNEIDVGLRHGETVPDPVLRQRDPDLYFRLRCAARGFTVRYYGAPVYLVGSAVTKEEPRDLDLVIVLPDDLFLASYGKPGETLDDYRRSLASSPAPTIHARWGRDCATQGAKLTRELHRAVDFKTTYESDTRTTAHLPRTLLAHGAAGFW